jgi:hypothetical protein
VARRKYGTHSAAISQAGQAAQPRDPSGDQSLAADLEPLPEYGKPDATAQPQATPEPAAEPQHYSLRDQLADQRRYAEQHALHQYIASNFPGALPHEAQWLMANPHHLSNPALIHAAAQIAAQRGIPRQDPQFLQFVGQLLDQHAAAQMQPAPAPNGPAPVPPSMPPMPPPVAHIDVEKVETPEGEPEAESVSMHHVSAPVSRGAEHYSADYEPGSDSRVHLSKAEREHAEAAGVSVEEYGRQKLRMMKMKKAKLIRDE